MTHPSLAFDRAMSSILLEHAGADDWPDMVHTLTITQARYLKFVAVGDPAEARRLAKEAIKAINGAIEGAKQ